MALGDMEQFSLRWNNFHSNLSSGFQSLLAEEDLVDVTLAAGGGVVQAHKIILSICSPYFKQVFKINPCKHPIVILKDVQHKDLVDILQFMYQGEVNVRQEDLGAFLKTAEMLQIKGLTGQDSPSEAPTERETPVHNLPNPPIDRLVPRIRPPRRRIDKPLQPPQPPLPRIDKLPSPRAQSPLPPYKRMRTDTPSSRSPVILIDETSGVECKDLQSPKTEPIDYEASTEPPSQSSTESTATVKDPPLDDSLIGESSSQSHQESMQGIPSESETQDSSSLGLLQQHADPKIIGHSSSISGATSETNTSQEGESGVPQFVESRKGKLQLVMGGFIYNLINPRERRQYWRCTEYSKKGCRGHITMVENQIVSLSPQPHNHEPLHDRIRFKMEMTRLKQQFQLEKLQVQHPQFDSLSSQCGVQTFAPSR